VGLVRIVHYGSLYLDASATQMSGKPACATRMFVRLQEATSDQAYRDKFAMLLAAWLAEKPVSRTGIGSCTSEGDEIINVVTLT
jgi:hypothetical protein